MIDFDEAYKKVLQHTFDLGMETVPLTESNGRVLAEDIKADRDFPPFNRSTKDGIALNYAAVEKGTVTFKVEGVLSAGMAQQTLSNGPNCYEIMTGAVVPNAADTVIMYEELTIINGTATISKKPKKGQNIHVKGNDEKLGAILLKKGKRVTAADIGVLASVGKAEVKVRRNPKICVISTGNELVEVSETPLPHQIRKSNTLSLAAALADENISATSLHLLDDQEIIENALEEALQHYDVLLLSGGVSKGKFDFIPDAMEALGVRKVFHKVWQRPGKPFWFGVQEELNTVVFSFPGNPVSTFANYHVYFLPWLTNTLGLPHAEHQVILDEPIQIDPPFVRFVQVTVHWEKASLHARLLKDGGSGDLTSLSKSAGFVLLRPKEEPYQKGELVTFIPTQAII
ncbi:molybdopterin molybdotransferase MoeA [Kriegella aquimaris]|uniref:Molybdopterin molybdenumtransferase n=1 Tax=Kriegella aquimaris TaxID=192904 RepID=A0A1G9JXX9_9FLAO|nr:molybdopterin molybdotransferase MoeA [Kriegella aquimaris]SDL42520.1 molybdopterin molybdochelatase [Kriegella aquimaris]